MRSESSTDVLIVGAGPAGLTTALWLAHTGVQFRIIDKRPNIPRRGQADGLSPRTMEILETFEVAHEVTRLWERATDEMLWCRDAQGNLTRMERFRNQPPQGVRWGHGTLQQGVVEEIMKKKITEVCGVEVEYETTLFELSLDTTKANDPEAFPWSATVRYGTDEPAGQMLSKTMLAKYVVGADGGRSFVRQTMGIEMQGTKGEAVWGVMDIIGTSDFPDDIDGAVDFVRREKDRDAITPESIIVKCEYIIRPYKLYIKEHVWWSAFTVAQRISNSMAVHNRGFLVGDAVHTHSPLCGAGMNTAVQLHRDAYNLGWKLAGVLKHQLNPEILQTYGAERRPVAEALLDADKTILALFHAPLGPEAEALLAKADHIQAYLSGRGIQYRASLLTHGSAEGLRSLAVLPGHCIPDITVQNYMTGRASNLHSWIMADGGWSVIFWASDLSCASRVENIHNCCKQVESIRAKTSSKVGYMLDAFLIHCNEWPSVDLAALPGLFLPPSKYGCLDYGKIFVREETASCKSERMNNLGGIAVVRPDKYVGWVGGLDDMVGLGLYFSKIFL
ncbi:uncharacterized protein ANIA_10814 [Aspergillus nidulans FGSC A4]|uniref:FAD-binding domain-containing protein n=1 Tax=Emericella nidulans (strain FGSC A4 / ATCC 38163 / CBS 112.46 / NRRL 194 / M139) TaxID=227321 RepID=C8V036_EMENI|nr:hypothetical protein [Aspergillus nidulans FGSC A4]CBF69357.1 TPA: conserved hypothetical protein [Aspergillus nidulans FGSC A4]